MSRSTPIFALGLVFVFAGLAFVAFTLRKAAAAPGAPAPRKSDLRALAVEQKNTQKMRIAGGVLAAFGAALVLIS
jgi:uncharacterized protein YjeT (DUF2065 family)